MEPKRKRVKITGKGTPRCDTEVTHYNHLVFDLVIRSLTSPKLIRKSRSICKSWNETACEVLRQKYIATVDERKVNKVDSFNELQRLRKESADLQSLPSSFRNVKVKAQSFTDPDFLNFIRSWAPALAVIRISLHEFDDEEESENNFKALQDLLVSCGETLEHLNFDWSSFNPKPKEFNLEQIKLSKLKHFKINLDESSTELFKVILRQSELTSLKIIFTNSTPLDLGPLDFESIPSHEVQASPHYGIDLDNYSTLLSLQNLKFLIVSAMLDTDSAVVAAILSKCSKSLETLCISGVKVPTHTLPKFPNLKTMSVDGTSLALVDPVKFPALEDLTLQANPDFELRFSHNGVQKLTYFAVRVLQADADEEERNACFKPEFPQSVKNLARIYPNVLHLVIYFVPGKLAFKLQGRQFPELIEMIHKSFRQLKTLEVDGLPLLLLQRIWRVPVDDREKCS